MASSMVFSLLGKDVSASKAIAGVGRELDQTSKHGEKFGKRVGAGVKLAAAAAGAAIATLAVSSVKAAAQDQQSQAVLAQTLKKNTGARDADVASTEDWISKLTLATGVADDQLRPALGNLVRATKDTGQAQDLLTTAMNVSASTGAPLESVAKAIAKAQGGQLGALQRLVPGLKDADGKSLSFKDSMVKLNEQFSGAQQAKQDTAAGKWQIMTNRWEEAKETIGGYLLPVLTGLMDFVSSHTGLVITLAAVFGGLALTVGIVSGVTAAYGAIASIVTAVTTGWQMAQFALNVALAANPIGVVIVAIIALVALIVLAWKKSDTFRRIVTGAFHAVGAAVQWVWNWIKGHWPLLLAILTGPIGLAVLAIGRHKDSILRFFKAIPGKIKGFFSGLWDIITAPFKTAFNAVAGFWNNTIGKIHFTIPDWPGVPHRGETISAPTIPLLANGGIVTRPTLAVLGEAGPEAVVPLSRGAGLGGGINLTVNINGRVYSRNTDIARDIIGGFQELANGGNLTAKRILAGA